MLKTIRNLLQNIIDNIDSGNCNISEEESIEVIDLLRDFSFKTKRFSKYVACEYLNISRSAFDGYIRDGLIPKGKKEIGFKELSWSQKDLDLFKKSRTNRHEN